MARIETLTAYKCKFSYLQRNNPLIEEQREAIKAGKEPEYSFSDFVSTYQIYTENLAIGENTDRAIILTSDKITEKATDGLKKWHIVPSAGKQGKPVTVIKKSSGKNMILVLIQLRYMNIIFSCMRMKMDYMLFFIDKMDRDAKVFSWKLQIKPLNQKD